MVGCVYGVYQLGYSVLWRGLSVGYGVHVWQVWRVVGVGMALVYGVLWRCVGVCGYGAMACVGMVYGVQALGVRMVYVVYVSLGVRCVYVVCVSFYDVVSLRRIRPNKTKHLKTIHQRYKTKHNEHKTNECLFNRIQMKVYIIYLNGS